MNQQGVLHGMRSGGNEPILVKRDGEDFTQRKSWGTPVPGGLGQNSVPGTGAPPDRTVESSRTPERNKPSDAARKKPADNNNNNMPKRALSAYNLFFHFERDRILRNCSDLPVTAEEVAAVAVRHHARFLTKKGPRPHRKSHGKIGFAELARTISARWKGLDPKTKAIFEDRARVEKILFKRRVEQGNDLVTEYGSSLQQNHTPAHVGICSPRPSMAMSRGLPQEISSLALVAPPHPATRRMYGMRFADLPPTSTSQYFPFAGNRATNDGGESLHSLIRRGHSFTSNYSMNHFRQSPMNKPLIRNKTVTMVSTKCGAPPPNLFSGSLYGFHLANRLAVPGQDYLEMAERTFDLAREVLPLPQRHLQEQPRPVRAFETEPDLSSSDQEQHCFPQAKLPFPSRVAPPQLEQTVFSEVDEAVMYEPLLLESAGDGHEGLQQDFDHLIGPDSDSFSLIDTFDT